MNLALAKLMKKIKIPLEAAGGHGKKLDRVGDLLSETSSHIGTQRMLQDSFDRGLSTIGMDVARTGTLLDRQKKLRDMQNLLEKSAKKTQKGVEYGSNALIASLPIASIYYALQGEDE